MNTNTQVAVSFLGIAVGVGFFLYGLTLVHDLGLAKKRLFCLESNLVYQRLDDVESCEPMPEPGP